MADLSNPLPTEAQLLSWIRLFRRHAKETTGRAKWPSNKDHVVWDKSAEGIWHEVSGQDWTIIDRLLRRSGFGKDMPASLTALKDKYGCNNDLTEFQILCLLGLFYERETRWPSTLDKNVWNKDDDGNWIVVNEESWTSIHKALDRKMRALGPDTPNSLAAFKDKYNCNDRCQPGGDLTITQIREWIVLFHEYKGRMPFLRDMNVWDKTSDGAWYAVSGLNWTIISYALQRKTQRLKASTPTSLKKFIKENFDTAPETKKKPPRPAETALKVTKPLIFA